MLCFWEDVEQGPGVPVSHRKGRAGACFGGSRACSLHLFSALPSLTCEVSLTKVNSKVLRSSQLVSAGEGRNSTLWAWALALWDTPRTSSSLSPRLGDAARLLQGSGLRAVPSASPAASTGRELGDSLCTPCLVQDDTCLAELALALSLSLEISSKRRLVGVRLRVQTLQAELHEGLFCSPLLHRVAAGAQRSSAGEQHSSGQGWGQGQALGRAGAGSPQIALEPEGFGCAIAPSHWGRGGLGKSLRVTLVCPSPGPGEPLKSLSLLSRDTLQLIPRRVEVKLENTSVVLSMNSQKR